MRHSFDLIYEVDCTVGEAVAAYLDAEHYLFLHANNLRDYEIDSNAENKVEIKQSWALGWFKFGNTCTTEYRPPNEFLNYDLKPFPAWVPSIHHLIKTRTHLKYNPSEKTDRTVSHLRVDIDMPWFLWPLRHFLQKKLTELKVQKDQEDVDMIHRYREVYGAGNLTPYLRKTQFMLHKDKFAAHFGAGANW